MAAGPIAPAPPSGPPWWVRIAVKSLLARLPLSDDVWRRFGVFRHGAMDDVGYAARILESHRRRAGVAALDGRTILELGPGDSVASAVIARAHGARAVLVDAGPFAASDVSFYRLLSDRLRTDGLGAPDLSEARSLDDVLAACEAEYLTEGLDSLRRLPSSSVHLVFSQAVLEHVRVAEFRATLHELGRVLTDDGVASHRVDLRDHLGGSLNNLRVPSSVWEQPWFVRGGFYTNRMALSEMMEAFRSTHSSVEVSVRTQWGSPPIPRNRLAREFRDRSDEDLRVAGFDVLLRGGGATAAPLSTEDSGLRSQG